jgi:hypothetical protein
MVKLSGEGLGHLHEETMEGEDFSHVDHSTIMVRHCREVWAASLRRSWRVETSPMWTTTIMVRRCGVGWAASLRKLWRAETPPTWTQPPSWQGDVGRDGPPPRENCGGQRLLPSGPNHYYGKELWGGVGLLLQDIMEGRDSSHVDPTTIMIRSCGEGWATSSRRSWREETPPMWTQPPSW